MRIRRFNAALLERLASAGRAVEQAVIPNSCAFCGTERPLRQPPVCAACRVDLPWITPRFHLDPCTTALAPLEYAFPVDAALKRFKYRRRLFYAPAFAHLLAPALRELPDGVDALLPMPLHWRRQALRGFNQAHEIVRGIRRATGMPVIGNVTRCRHTPAQSSLCATQRQRNVKGAFRVKGSLRHRHVVIVDDVITTGASCRELARVLLRSGAKEVSALAVARVTGPPRPGSG